MVRCGRCGQESPADASFCENCGMQLSSPTSAEKPPVDQVLPGISVAGRKIGEAFAGMGRAWGEEGRRTDLGLMAWWDRTLGLAAPIVSGLIGVFALLLAIVILGSISTLTEHEVFWNDIKSFVVNYLWVFVGLIFLSSVSNYMHRRFRKTWRWVIPVPIALGAVGWLWILAEVVKIAGADLDHPTLRHLAGISELLLPLLFVGLLILGYMMVFWITMGERGDEPHRYDEHGRIR